MHEKGARHFKIEFEAGEKIHSINTCAFVHYIGIQVESTTYYAIPNASDYLFEM